MLLDTSGLLCLIHRREAQHEGAISLYDAATTRVTHSYVLGESVSFALARRLSRRAALDSSERVMNDNAIETICPYNPFWFRVSWWIAAGCGGRVPTISGLTGNPGRSSASLPAHKHAGLSLYPGACRGFRGRRCRRRRGRASRLRNLLRHGCLSWPRTA